MTTFRAVLRMVAIVIATAAVIDPPITRHVAARGPITVVAVDEFSVTSAARLRDRLATRDARTTLHDPASAAAACPETGGCVLVSSGTVPVRVTAGARVLGGVRVTDQRGRTSDRPSIARIDASSRTHRNATGRLRVWTTTPAERIDVFDADTLVGSVETKGQTTVDVPWVALGAGARALRVVAGDDFAHVGVVVDDTPAAVVFYEPRPTWLGTFVRRALEDDPRFSINARARPAPPVIITRGNTAPLTSTSIDAASTIVVSAPEMLSNEEVEALERFVEHRGGSLIVLTDRRPSGAALRLLPRIEAERATAQPQAAGLLRASEWLSFEALAPDVALASIDQHPVIISRALGRGRVVVSGVMDAWRFRHSSNDFHTFWTTLLWDAATAAGPRLRVETDRVIAAPGEPLTLTAELQSLDVYPQEITAAGHITCANRRDELRLWPGVRARSFAATFRVEDVGTCTVSVTVAGVTSRAPVTIRDDLRRVTANDEAFGATIAAYGGKLVGSDDEDELVRHVDASVSSMEKPTEQWPMRSPYWILPFVACLASEWWLRRRSGLS